MAFLWKVQTLFTGGGVTGGGVATHFFNAATGTPQDAADALAAMWTEIDSYMSSLVSWEIDPEVIIVESTTGDTSGVTPVTSTGSAGSDSSGIATLQTQALIRWRTGAFVAGRELRGRTFVPGIPKSLITATGGVSTTLSAIVSNAAMDVVEAADCDLVIYSRTHHEYASVDVATCWNKFAELRSRRD